MATSLETNAVVVTRVYVLLHVVLKTLEFRTEKRQKKDNKKKLLFISSPTEKGRNLTRFRR